jgi:hypothetical protein
MEGGIKFVQKVVNIIHGEIHAIAKSENTLKIFEDIQDLMSMISIHLKFDMKYLWDNVDVL